MSEERFESYVYQIMQYVKYQENKPYIESILEEMRYTLFREDRNYIKQLEQRIDKAIEYIQNKKQFQQGCDTYQIIDWNYVLKILGDGNNE